MKEYLHLISLAAYFSASAVGSSLSLWPLTLGAPKGLSPWTFSLLFLLENLPSLGFKYHLYHESSQIDISSSHPSHLLDISVWMFILGISNVTRLKLSYWYHTLPQPCLISVFSISISDKYVFPQTSKISLISNKSCWLYLKNLSRIWALPTTFTQQPGPGHSHLSYGRLFICSQCDFQSEHLKTNPDLSLLCSESSSGFSAHSEKSQSPHNGLKGPVVCSAWAHCHTSLTSSFTTFPHAHWLQPHCLLAVSGMF